MAVLLRVVVKAGKVAGDWNTLRGCGCGLCNVT
jgi:hypothetical protein